MRREPFTSHSLDTFGRQTLKSIIVDEGEVGEVVGRLAVEGAELLRFDLELCSNDILFVFFYEKSEVLFCSFVYSTSVKNLHLAVRSGSRGADRHDNRIKKKQQLEIAFDSDGHLASEALLPIHRLSLARSRLSACARVTEPQSRFCCVAPRART